MAGLTVHRLPSSDDFPSCNMQHAVRSRTQLVAADRRCTLAVLCFEWQYPVVIAMLKAVICAYSNKKCR